MIDPRRLTEMEEWRKIPELETYEVSNFGNVRRGVRQLKCNTRIHPNGYKQLSIGLNKNGVQKTYIVSRLVAQAFLPNPDNLPTVDHIDRDSTNNHVSNLRWASRHTQVMNRTVQVGSSGEKNIRKHYNRWEVRIQRHNQLIFLKSFPTFEEAVAARDAYFNSECNSE